MYRFFIYDIFLVWDYLLFDKEIQSFSIYYFCVLVSKLKQIIFTLYSVPYFTSSDFGTLLFSVCFWWFVSFLLCDYVLSCVLIFNSDGQDTKYSDSQCLKD